MRNSSSGTRRGELPHLRAIVSIWMSAGLLLLGLTATPASASTLVFEWSENPITLTSVEALEERIFHVTLTNVTEEEQNLWVAGLDPEWNGRDDQFGGRFGVDHAYGCGGNGVSSPAPIQPGGICQIRVHFQAPWYGCPIDDPCEKVINFLESGGVPALPVSATGPEPSPPSPAKPDLLIAKVGGSTVGNNIYNSTGKNQTIATKTKRGKSANFTIKVQNDGAKGSVVVSGCQSGDGFKVSYWKGTLNVTPAIVAGQYSGTLSHGESTKLTLKVAVKKSATVGKTKTCLVRGTAKSKDVVRAKVTAIKS